MSDAQTTGCNLANGESIHITDTGSINIALWINDFGAVTAINGAKGSIVNDGTLLTLSTMRAVVLDQDATVDGIVNTGTITGSHGIELGRYTEATLNAGSGVFSGIALYNSGTVNTFSTLTDGSALKVGSTSTINGDIVNTYTGTLNGDQYGINIASIGATINGSILNDGVISGGGSGIINAGQIVGSIVNSSTGSVTGDDYAIYNTGAITGDVDNRGMVSGATSGVYNSGTIDNILNSGTIIGQAATGGAGIVYAIGGTGGVLSNTGTISGATGLLHQRDGTTTSNTGTISGTNGTAVSITGNNNTLILGTGSVLNGSAISTGTGNLLQLQGAGSEDSDLTGFESLTMSGTNWTLGGTLSTTGTTATATHIQSGGMIVTGTLSNSGVGGGTTIDAGAALQLGDGGTTGSIVGNIDNAGTLIINRSDELNLSSVINGTGTFTQAGTGTTTLSSANHYSGATNVIQGSLKAGAANTFSAASSYTVASGATLDTGGFNQTVAALDNAGTVNLLNGTPGSSLTVTGAYVGHGGALLMETRLGDSNSASDRLVLNGPGASASGSTTLQITNVDGLGALTTGDGIEVITALNGATTTAQTSKDAFVLAGEIATAGWARGSTMLSARHIDVGAYEYRLYAADANGQGENWYLRSSTPLTPPDDPAPPIPEPPIPEPPVPEPSIPEPPAPVIPPVVVPTYRAEVPMVAALPAQLRQGDLAMLGNRHRRIGDGHAAEASNGTSSDHRVWARAVYTDLNIRQDGTVVPHSDGYLSGLQAGTDLWSNTAWRTGLYVGYLEGGIDVKGNASGVFRRVGYNDLQSRYLGGYATWTDAKGIYVDAVLQAGDHRYSLRPDLLAHVSDKAHSWTVSMEVGQPFVLAAGWSIEPQAQLTYQQASFDELRISGARVQQKTDAGWIGRLGVRIKGDTMTAVGRLQPYGQVSLYYAGSGTDTARFISPAAVTDIDSRSGYTSAEVSGGLMLALGKTASLYGEVGHVFDASGDARVRSSVQGSMGVRFKW